MKNEGDKLAFNENIEVTKETKELLRDLLKADPDQRITWKMFFTSEVFKRTICSD